MMIVSIGFALLLRSIYQYTFGGSTKTLSQYVAQGRNDYGPIALSDKEIAIFGIAIVTLVITCIALMRLASARRCARSLTTQHSPHRLACGSMASSQLYGSLAQH